VEFECDSDRVLRWLLKLLFNDARASRGGSPERYAGLRPFILGRDSNPSIALDVVIGLIEPFSPPNSTELFYPEHLGFADFDLRHPSSADLLWFRGVFLNSFLFCVLAWQSGVARPARKRILADFARNLSLHRLNRPTCSTYIRGACMTTEPLMRSTTDGNVVIEAPT
jgi:hypothetical protein